MLTGQLNSQLGKDTRICYGYKQSSNKLIIIKDKIMIMHRLSETKSSKKKKKKKEKNKI